MREYAHFDQPLRYESLHMSAPHIYGSVLEHLQSDEVCTVLNVGSGTGYLSSLLAEVVPNGSTVYSIEIQEACVEHAAECMGMPIILGNGLKISETQGQGRLGLDRIYVGAALGSEDVASMAQLLRVGGVMVSPGEYNRMQDA